MVAKSVFEVPIWWPKNIIEVPIWWPKNIFEVPIWWTKNIIEVPIWWPIKINDIRMSTTKCCATPIYGWQRPRVRSPNHGSVCFQGKIKPEQVLFLQTQDAGLGVKLKLTIDQKLEKPSQRHPERSAEDRVSCLTPAQLVKSISAQDLRRKHC